MSALLLANVTCVAIGERGLLIEGTPGSGKSSLALALIDRGASLVGDDGITLEVRNGTLYALPPPTTAGLLEIRGIGIVEMPCTSAPVSLALMLASDAPRAPEPETRALAGIAVPRLRLLSGDPLLHLRAEHALAVFGAA